ncbi:morphogenic membrane protein MmpA [Streptomyces sp. NPDC053750]|uniref:morphogenic membrane protein MmpA n=1 Tax=Streptomyces sp. NPDC053750 TaxID=3365714 RepID=UPI0037D7D7F4
MTTTHRGPQRPVPQTRRPAERAVGAGLVLAVVAGLAWLGGMIYTIVGWSG